MKLAQCALVAVVVWAAPLVVAAQTADASVDRAAVPQCRESWTRDGACGHNERRWVWGPSLEGVGAGLGGLALFYLVQVVSTAVSAAQADHDVAAGAYTSAQLEDYRRWGYIPVVGPWAKLGLAPPNVTEGGEVLFAIEGLLELGSLAFFVVSLFGSEQDTWVPQRTGSWRITPRATGLSFDLVF